MPALIEPLDASAAMDELEARGQALAAISEQQWELIEACCAAGGPAGTGSLQRWGRVASGRMLELCELPAAWLQALVDHLLLLRFADLAEALVWADPDCELLAALVERHSEIEGRRERAIGRPRTARRSTATERAAAWERALADPMAALEQIAQIEADTPEGTHRSRLIARLLGIQTKDSVLTLRCEITRRRELLEDLAEPPAAVETVQPAERLLAEALDPALRQPSTLAAIAGWQARPGLPWNQWFRHLRDHLGPSAAAEISRATGAPIAEVVEHGRQVWAQHARDREALRGAYPALAVLLRDATVAGGWEALAEGLGVQLEAVWGRAKELAEQG